MVFVLRVNVIYRGSIVNI